MEMFSISTRRAFVLSSSPSPQRFVPDNEAMLLANLAFQISFLFSVPMIRLNNLKSFGRRSPPVRLAPRVQVDDVSQIDRNEIRK